MTRDGFVRGVMAGLALLVAVSWPWWGDPSRHDGRALLALLLALVGLGLAFAPTATVVDPVLDLDPGPAPGGGLIPRPRRSAESCRVDTVYDQDLEDEWASAAARVAAAGHVPTDRLLLSLLTVGAGLVLVVNRADVVGAVRAAP